jgi:hypothetical protein
MGGLPTGGDTTNRGGGGGFGQLRPAEPPPSVPNWMSHGDSMAGLPQGGNVEPLSQSGGMAGLPTGGDTSSPQDWGVTSPETSQSMPGAGEPSLGQLMEMISSYMENAASSNGT